ncbi:F-box/LRR-repeat protein At3g26922-like isoform X2 [Durio zibethinus]|uniref:F-box/LRR-repeat protein At3g26922-like isoform X2 n=1 Tax=Durio zibethinus TaxID=66656 RepID=A0A6P5Z4M0_DURZI|nr:F-box/LRR-repeat protein At3g26922-like isoform X2 [Durio zibethinus]
MQSPNSALLRILDMDASASPNSAKIQKVFGGQDASQEKDLVSRLPDDILVHILSFLPTEDAIKTSILSKRWKYLWVSIPNFCFCDHSVWSRTMSHDLLLEVLASFFSSVESGAPVQNGPCIGKFYRWLEMPVAASRLRSWLSAAVKHNVQELKLFLPKGIEFVLPNSLFTSKSLWHFTLKMDCNLKLPGFICFSSLKYLNLRGVTFQDDQSTQQLFSGFPVLEHLTLFKCNWGNINEITIEIPTLKSLTFFEKVIFEDNFLNCKIVISALNLETLKVRGYLNVELLPCNLLSLDEASVNIEYLIDGQQEHSHRLVKLLCGLPNIKSLKLSNEALECLLFAESCPGHLPTFYNLTTLNASMNGPYVMNDDYTSGALIYVLQKSPNLKSLILSRGFEPEDVDMIMDIVPGCFQHCLKSVLIYNVDGAAQELCSLKYLYENAPVLESLSVICSPQLTKDLEKQEEIRHELEQLRGGSGSCKIVFLPYGASL